MYLHIPHDLKIVPFCTRKERAISIFIVTLLTLNMDLDRPEESESLNSYIDGPEEDYTDCVQVLSEKNAV